MAQVPIEQSFIEINLKKKKVRQMFDGINWNESCGFSAVLRLNSDSKRREITANELRTSVSKLAGNG
jgi:hypothetical protein